MKKAILFVAIFVTASAIKAQEIFDMPGATGTYLTGINDSGEICGYYTTASATIAFEIDKYGDTIKLTGPGGSNAYCTATGINNKGLVVGNYATTNSNAAAKGFIFYPNPGRNAGGTYANVTSGWGGTYITASGIADDTCISGNFQNGTYQDGALWCQGNTQENDLVCYNQSTRYSTFCYALDNSGNAGGFIVQGAQEQCAIYRIATLSWDTFMLGGNIKSRIYGMNDNGWVCGNYSSEGKGFYGKKLAGQAITNLTTILVKGAITIYPYDINNQNDIVGYYTDASNVTHGFLIAKYDIGFRPSVNGYNWINNEAQTWPQTYWGGISYATDPYLNNGSPFPRNQGAVVNSKVFIDWPDVVKSMALSDFYSTLANGKKKLKQAAWDWYAFGAFKGSCFGFSNTAGQLFDNPSWYFGLFPGLSQYQNMNTFSWPNNNTTLSPLHQTQSKQLSTYYNAYRNVHYYDLLPVTMQTLKQSLRDSRGRAHRVMVIIIQGTAGSHAVLPYKLSPNPQGNGIDTVFIYDPNFPGVDLVPLIVNQNAGNGGNFSYTAGGRQVEWGNTPNGQGLYMYPQDSADIITLHISALPQFQNLSTRSTGTIQCSYNDSSRVHMTDDNDSVAVFSTDSNIGTPLIIPVPTLTGVAGDQTRQVSSLSGVTLVNKVTDAGFSFTPPYLSIAEPSYVIRCNRTGGDDTVDNFSFSSGTLTFLNNNADTAGLQFAVDVEDDSDEYSYDISNLNVVAGNKITVSVYGAQGAEIQNYGPATTYVITTQFTTDTFSTFTGTIPISANTTQIIQPHDTTYSGIYIMVDTGMQGHYEDTIFITPTGVNGINTISAAKIAVWPVPAGDMLNISGPTGLISYTVFDMLGNTVLSGKADFGNGQTRTVDISTLIPGVYVIQGKGFNGNWNYPFVKD